MEKVFVMIKPDGVQRSLVGICIQKLENKGLKLEALKFMNPTVELIRETYIEEINEPYFPVLLRVLTEAPVVPMIWSGKESIRIVNTLKSNLPTNLAPPGSIRGDFCIHVGRNILHSPDTLDDSERLIQLWFPNNI